MNDFETYGVFDPPYLEGAEQDYYEPIYCYECGNESPTSELFVYLGHNLCKTCTDYMIAYGEAKKNQFKPYIN